ncbi:MAG: hypothetical protein L6M37_03570 [Candidatus Methylarchaceae archaeon HK02M1]|nr:hypothetical protein [Candidatus Methylarchaceae archaeon HK02M1]
MVTHVSLGVLVKFVKHIEKDEIAEDNAATDIAEILGSVDFSKELNKLIKKFAQNVDKAALENVTYEPCIPYFGYLPRKPDVRHPV